MANESDRIEWYHRSLKLWNQDASSRDAIVIAQNSRFNFNLPRLETVVFEHSVKHELLHCGRSTRNMGEHELVAIHEALAKAGRVINATRWRLLISKER